MGTICGVWGNYPCPGVSHPDEVRKPRFRLNQLLSTSATNRQRGKSNGMPSGRRRKHRLVKQVAGKWSGGRLVGGWHFFSFVDDHHIKHRLAPHQPQAQFWLDGGSKVRPRFAGVARRSGGRSGPRLSRRWRRKSDSLIDHVIDIVIVSPGQASLIQNGAVQHVPQRGGQL